MIDYPNSSELRNLALLVRDTIKEFDLREKLMRRRILVLQHQRDHLQYQVDNNNHHSIQQQSSSSQQHPADNINSHHSDLEVLRRLINVRSNNRTNFDPIWFKRVRNELNQVSEDEEEKLSKLKSNTDDNNFDYDRDDTYIDSITSASPRNGDSLNSNIIYPPRPPARQSLREDNNDDDDDLEQPSFKPDLVAYRNLAEAFERLADENIRSGYAVHQILKDYRLRSES